MTPFDARTNESLTATGAVNYAALGAVKLMLLTAVQAPDPSTHSVMTDVSANEVAAGIAYATGGPTLTGVTFSKVGNNYVLSANDVSIAQDAVSGFSNARYAVAYQVSSGKLLAFEDFNTNRTNTDRILDLKFTGAELLKWVRG